MFQDSEPSSEKTGIPNILNRGVNIVSTKHFKKHIKTIEGKIKREPNPIAIEELKY